MGVLTENQKRRLAVDLRLSSSAHPVFHLAAEPSPPSKKIKRLSPPVSLCAITPLTQVAQTPTPAARSFPPPAPLPRPVHGPQRILRAFGLGSANGSRLLPSPEGSKNTPPEGSKNTPPHHSTEFRWKDYCPMVFRHLRILFDVDPADYMLVVCGNDALSELSSPGKSGSVFHLTQDDRFMIKTVKKAEVR